MPLKNLNTFQIGGRTRYFAVIKNEEDLREGLTFAKSRKLPIFIFGGGSNLLLSDHGFDGLVLKNEIKGIKFIDTDADWVMAEIGAGEIWDEVVALSVIRNLSGLENLAGIPGTVGGATVQNAGAYGIEIKDCLFSVSGLNLVNGKKFTFSKVECQYGYRDSLFKHNKKYFITSVVLSLRKKPVFNLEYDGLKQKLVDESHLTSAKIREAVLQIRAEKLPDWHKMGTAGSFFKNPIITEDKYIELKKIYPDLPNFLEKKGYVKVPLAWILDKICNLKNFKEGAVGLYEKQPLVLVNFGEATAKDIKNFSEKIKNIVREKTGIEIETEVEGLSTVL